MKMKTLVGSIFSALFLSLHQCELPETMAVPNHRLYTSHPAYIHLCMYDVSCMLRKGIFVIWMYVFNGTTGIG
jgi:hypothetical protein